MKEHNNPSIYYGARIDKKIKGYMLKQVKNQNIKLNVIQEDDQEYRAIGVVVHREVTEVKGANAKIMSAIRQAI